MLEGVLQILHQQRVNTCLHSQTQDFCISTIEASPQQDLSHADGVAHLIWLFQVQFADYLEVRVLWVRDFIGE